MHLYMGGIMLLCSWMNAKGKAPDDVPFLKWADPTGTVCKNIPQPVPGAAKLSLYRKRVNAAATMDKLEDFFNGDDHAITVDEPKLQAGVGADDSIIRTVLLRKRRSTSTSEVSATRYISEGDRVTVNMASPSRTNKGAILNVGEVTAPAPVVHGFKFLVPNVPQAIINHYWPFNKAPTEQLMDVSEMAVNSMIVAAALNGYNPLKLTIPGIVQAKDQSAHKTTLFDEKYYPGTTNGQPSYAAAPSYDQQPAIASGSVYYQPSYAAPSYDQPSHATGSSYDQSYAAAPAYNNQPSYTAAPAYDQPAYPSASPYNQPTYVAPPAYATGVFESCSMSCVNGECVKKCLSCKDGVCV